MPLKQWGRPVKIGIQTRALVRWKRHLERELVVRGCRRRELLPREINRNRKWNGGLYDYDT